MLQWFVSARKVSEHHPFLLRGGGQSCFVSPKKIFGNIFFQSETDNKCRNRKGGAAYGGIPLFNRQDVILVRDVLFVSFQTVGTLVRVRHPKLV